MDRNFYDNDFEEFLKQKSDQYKMYPSDRVWNNVYSSLHGRKKWWALGFTLFFIGAGLLAGRQVLLADYNRITAQLNKQTTSLLSTTASQRTGLNTASPSYTIIPVTTINQNTALTASGKADLAKNTNTGSLLSDAVTITSARSVAAPSTRAETDNIIIDNDPGGSVPAGTTQRTAFETSAIPFPLKQSEVIAQAIIEAQQKKEAVTKPVDHLTNAVAASRLLKPSRWSLQVYASPTVSYRRLSNFDQQPSNHVPVAATYADDVNRYVNHRPAPGFELGTNIQYKLSDNLSVFAGAQLNYSRYYINAYKYNREKASIELEKKAFVRDTLSGYTDIRNFSGYKPEQLQNKYLQLSVPVGIEIKLLGHKKLQFSVAGSVQPTFLLTSTSYLLSSDYKNYIQSPDLARTFNVHTNFEAFVSYQAAGLKWQIGPQFRSQLLSSYSNQYRVREYLTEYGIKIGVSKSLR